MYWLDTAILIVLALAALLGARSGFVGQVARLLTLGVSLYGTIRLNEPATRLLAESVLSGADGWLARGAAYVIVFLAIYVVLLAVTLFLERGVRAAQMQWLNRLMGAALGAVKAALVLGVVFLGLVHFAPDFSQAPLERSYLASYLSEGAQRVLRAIPAEYREKVWSQVREWEATEEAEPQPDDADR
jgi:membrane protein required for colicin V production